MVIPTLNEAEIIEDNLRLIVAAMHRYFAEEDWKVVVADNGSTDGTGEIVRRLSVAEPRLGLWESDKKGKGLAIRGAWSDNDADVYAFMDADLSTNLDDLPALIQALNTADIAVGSRFLGGASCVRSWRREVVSRVYVALRNLFVRLSVKDSQCGFKAIKREAWKQIKTDLIHTGWFFDTELLSFAQARRKCIVEVPIRWAEAPHGKRKSKMPIWRSAKESMGYLVDLRKRLKKFV